MIFQVGDLVEPVMVFDPLTLGVVTGVNRDLDQLAYSYDIQWVGQPILEAWTPKEMRLVSRGKNNNNEVKKANREQD
jgi:hypothetical protein